jgi:hypothetical protein
MLDSFKPNTGDMQGHLKIYENFQRVKDQHPLSDKVPIRYDFETPFAVKIYERVGWNHVPIEQSILTYYTDGSREDGMTGLGFFGPSVRFYEALGTSITIFQAEMFAINVCARICLNTEGLASRKPICVRALKSYTSTSKLVASITLKSRPLSVH